MIKIYIFLIEIIITDMWNLSSICLLIQNRDLYDSHFMFDRMFEINEAIIQQRTNKNSAEYLKSLEQYIRKEVDKNKILQGLGELLEEKKKQWVKNSLVDELLFQIRLKIDSLER